MNVVKVTYRKKRDESKLYVENIELGKYVCVCTGMYIIHYIFKMCMCIISHIYIFCVKTTNSE